MQCKWIGSWVLAAVLAGAGAAQAASVDYYLEVDGIEGDSKHDSHRGWIDVLSFSWGVTHSTGSGQGGAGSAGKPVFQDFSWSQIVDSSIPSMFVELTQGRHIKEVTLDVVRPGDKSSSPFFQMTFENVLLSSLSVAGSGEEPVASLSFSYSKIELVYTPQDPKGGAGSAVKGGWDLKNAKTSFSGDPMVVLGLFESGGNVNLAAVPEVPEPSTYALFALGLLAVATVTRRRRAT